MVVIQHSLYVISNVVLVVTYHNKRVQKQQMLSNEDFGFGYFLIIGFGTRRINLLVSSSINKCLLYQLVSVFEDNSGMPELSMKFNTKIIFSNF